LDVALSEGYTEGVAPVCMITWMPASRSAAKASADVGLIGSAIEGAYDLSVTV